MKTKLIFPVFTLAALFFTACNKDEPHALFGTESQEGRVTFTFPNVNGVATYAAIANENESWLNMESMYIYVVGGKAGKEQVEMVYTGRDITSDVKGASVTATVSVPEWLVNEEKTFYFMADMGKTASRAASTLVDGTPLNVLSKATTNELDDKTLLSSADGLLLTGKIKVNLKTDRTLKTVTLKRRVARFDVSNNSASSKVTIKNISIGSANCSGYVFADNSPDRQEDAKKGDLQVIPFEGVKNANAGHAESVFYLYPAPRNSTSIYLLAVVDGAERLFSVPSPKNGIEANKRYTIVLKEDEDGQAFALEVGDWDASDEPLPLVNRKVKLVGVEVISGETGWNAATNTFNPNVKGQLKVTVRSQYGSGVKIDAVPLQDDNRYFSDITYTTLSVPEFSHSEGFTQTTMLTIPRYTGNTPIHIHIRFRDNVAEPSSETVITLRNGINDGWAGSNIYWDEKSGKLTFDDVGVTANQNYQGVFFKWGSLWGISPTGIEWNTTEEWDIMKFFFEIFNFSGNSSEEAELRTIVYRPTENGSHKKTMVEKWDSIPRFNQKETTPADLALVVHTEVSVKAGIGDICKYLSPLHGKNWRLPEVNELGGSADYKQVNSGAFNANNTTGKTTPDGKSAISSGWRKTTDKGTDVFFPAAGNRNESGRLNNVGYFGNYWSSSPYNITQGYNLWINNTAVHLTNGNKRKDGISVRCVVVNN